MTTAEEEQAQAPDAPAQNNSAHPGSATAPQTPVANIDGRSETSWVPPAPATSQPAAPQNNAHRPPEPGPWLAPVDQTVLAPPSAAPGSWRQRARRASAWADERLAAGAEQFDERITPRAQQLSGFTLPLSRRASRVDLLTLARNISLIALGALVIAAAAHLEVELGLLTAPLWLFLAAALLVGASLGAVRGSLAAGLYLAVGIFGTSMIPGAAAEHLEGPWAGVLLSLPLAAAITGLICSRHASLRSLVTSKWYFFGWFFFAALTGWITTYAFTLILLAQRIEVDGWELFATMSSRFPFDAALCVLVGVLATVLHRIFPGLLRGRRRSPRPQSGGSVRTGR